MNEPTSMPEPPSPRPILPAFPAAEPPSAERSASNTEHRAEVPSEPAADPVAEFAAAFASQAAGGPGQVPTAEMALEPGPRVPNRMLDECDLRSPRIRRRVVLPVVLFLTACVTTFAAGAYGWKMAVLDDSFFQLARANWRQGLEYMAAAMAVLLAHEMGHFLMSVRYRVPASYPVFLPVPIMLTGTMGAVIGMDGRRADRKQLFDIGIAGPLAGLVLTVPLIFAGILTAKAAPPLKEPDPAALFSPQSQAIEHANEEALQAHFGQPLAVTLLRAWLRPEISPDAELVPNALYMAGWLGLLITGLNMLPISQLDGGHIIHGLFGRDARWIGRSLLIAAIAYIIVAEAYSWTLMLLLVIFLGTDHPPTANDQVRIGAWRWALGIASLLIPIFCFTLVPLLTD
ncbi:MAG TPA: site-2 protease family protein [Pirellulales bacterium]|nr:site-2 protease family protein [Pirellulales bacterium]